MDTATTPTPARLSFAYQMLGFLIAIPSYTESECNMSDTLKSSTKFTSYGLMCCPVAPVSLRVTARCDKCRRSFAERPFGRLLSEDTGPRQI